MKGKHRTYELCRNIMNKKLVIIIIVSLMVSSIVLIMDKKMDRRANVEQLEATEIISGEEVESVPNEDFYNEGIIISTNVFFRINEMPLTEDKSKLGILKDEIKGFEDEIKFLERNEDTKEAEEKLENLIRLAYAAIELYEMKLSSEDEIPMLDILNKMTEVQNEYLSFSELFDSSGVKITNESKKRILDITKEFTN